MMDTKYVRIWMRGWPGDEPDAVSTTICDLVLDVADEARVMIACDAVAERFVNQGLASMLSAYDRASFRHRLMDGMMTALGNYVDDLDGSRFHEEVVDEHAYVLAATLTPWSTC